MFFIYRHLLGASFNVINRNNRSLDCFKLETTDDKGIGIKSTINNKCDECVLICGANNYNFKQHLCHNFILVN